MKRIITVLILLLFGVELARASSDSGAMQVSTFSTILTEIAERVGGEYVKVTSHVPIGMDPHDFEPKPSDLKAVSRANVVLLLAKKMEGYTGKIRDIVTSDVRIVEVGKAIPSIWVTLEGGKGKMEDPHWWHSPEQMQRAVAYVSSEFALARPALRKQFEANATAYTQQLRMLQDWARLRVAEIPRHRRILVTSHDAFGYFAKEYGFVVYAVEGLTPSDQPSSRKVAELLDVIREKKVRTVFSQDSANPKVVRQMTAETGAVLGESLWVEGLVEGEGRTYEGMFRHNVNAIVNGVKEL